MCVCVCVCVCVCARMRTCVRECVWFSCTPMLWLELHSMFCIQLCCGLLLCRHGSEVSPEAIGRPVTSLDASTTSAGRPTSPTPPEKDILVCTCVCVCVCTYVHTHVCVCTYIHMFLCVCTHLYTICRHAFVLAHT